MSTGCVRLLSTKLKTIHLPPGDALLHEGDLVNMLYFVARGSIEITRDERVTAIIGIANLLFARLTDQIYDDFRRRYAVRRPFSVPCSYLEN